MSLFKLFLLTFGTRRGGVGTLWQDYDSNAPNKGNKIKGNTAGIFADTGTFLKNNERSILIADVRRKNQK